MLLWHVTHRVNWKSISAAGLDPRYATGAEAAVWLFTHSRYWWALYHISARHQWPITECICLECAVPRSWLSRRRRGVWIVDRIIPPERINVCSTLVANNLARLWAGPCGTLAEA